MTLTYSMVLNRLDVVNEREKQVRKFYKPLAQPQADVKRPWPRRHRFADVMEPGDVIRTISKTGDDWDGDNDYNGQSKALENTNVSQSWQAASEGGDTREHTAQTEASLAQARLRAPSRDNQPLLGYVSKVERKLKKSIEMDVEERRKGLKAQLQREMKPGEDAPEVESIEPLFKPPRSAQNSARRRLDIKNFCTDAASSRELAVYDVSSRVGRESREAVANRGAVDILDLTDRGPEALDTTASNPASPRWARHDADRDPPSSAAAAPGGGGSHPVRREDSHHDASGGGGGGGGGDAGEQDGHGHAALGGGGSGRSLAAAADELQGDVSSWRYKRTVTSPHDDPDRKEFYYLQLRVDPSLCGGGGDARFDVCVRSASLQSRPEVWLRGLACDAGGRLRVPRADGSGAASTVFSPAEYLPWVTSPQQLLGHALQIVTYTAGGGGGGGDAVSPSTAKRQELSRMRAQMRANLQQTQTAVLSSLGPARSRPGGGAATPDAPPAVGGLAPMTITPMARPDSRGGA